MWDPPPATLSFTIKNGNTSDGGRVSCSAGPGASLAGIGFSVVAERAETVVLAEMTTQFTAIHRCGSEGCLTAKGDIGCWSSNGVVDYLGGVEIRGQEGDDGHGVVLDALWVTMALQMDVFAV
jgi:hypothetical protein